MNSLFQKSIVLFLIAVTATSCFNKDSPNYQYFPDMYESVPYDTYGEYNIFINEQSAKLPVEGTVSRGWMPYEYEDSNEGYAQAKAELKNPLPYTEENLTKGKALYNIYCAVCHGEKGDGQGILVQREKILGIPSYDDQGRAITEGSVYHVMYFGLNAMGSYASQTSIEDRWQIDHYVMQLKGALEGSPERAFDVETEGDVIPAVGADTTATQESDVTLTSDQPESTN